MDSRIATIYMDWDDINSIIKDLKDVLDNMDDASPDFKEFKVGIARRLHPCVQKKVIATKIYPAWVWFLICHRPGSRMLKPSWMPSYVRN